MDVLGTSKEDLGLRAKYQTLLPNLSELVFPLVILNLHLFVAFLTLAIPLCKSQTDFRKTLQGNIPNPC